MYLMEDTMVVTAELGNKIVEVPSRLAKKVEECKAHIVACTEAYGLFHEAWFTFLQIVEKCDRNILTEEMLESFAEGALTEWDC